MTVLPQVFYSALSLFPESRERALRLLRERESFRSVCEDYEQCLRSFRYWSGSAAEEAVARRDEYAALLEDLETEVRQQIDAAQGGDREEDDAQRG